eukprot:11203853-Alexandrium_andersonii.AAC.1
MSASLVGSEMCIRDSANAKVAAPTQPAPCGARPRLPMRLRASRGPRGSGCLLYTSDAADDM